MNVCEAFPGDDTAELGKIDPECVDGEGDGEESVHRRDRHETEVAVNGQGLDSSGMEELCHFPSAFGEGVEGQATVDGRDDAKDDRPHPEEEIGRRGVNGDGEAADLLEDIEAVALNKPVWSRKKHEMR